MTPAHRSPNESAYTNPQQAMTGRISDKLPEFPIGPGKALKYFMPKLTDFEKGEILDYREIHFLGMNAKKIDANPGHQYNFGYDNDKGDYRSVVRDHICYRYEVLEFLGKGSFGQALKCLDHKTNKYVCVKIIRNKEKFQYQAHIEIKVLQHIKDADPDDTSNIIKIGDYFVFRSHICIVFELLSINLYEFIKNTDFTGVSLALIRRFAIQILHALRFTLQQNIIHCDLKPENILLKTPTKSGIKIIDYGSSCFSDEIVYTYIQSRFYRAPEIMLGIPYTSAIDMWSFGCICTELFTGLPLFPGESEKEQLALIMEMKGAPSSDVLDRSQHKHKFFDKLSNPIIFQNKQGEKKIPGRKSIRKTLGCEDDKFLDFVEKCLHWDPEIRLTPDDALRHEWILEGLPYNVLIHHCAVYGIDMDEVPEYIRNP